MAYDDFEFSSSESRPNELYRFTYGGDGRAYVVTSSAFDFPFSGEIYKAIPIKRSEIKRSEEVGKNNLSVYLKRDNSYFNRFLAGTLTYPTTLVLYSIQEDESFRELWTGEVKSVTKTPDHLDVTLSPISSGARRSILHRKYSIQCPHALYSYYCQVVTGAYTRTGTIQSISGSVIISPAFSLEEDGWFSGGTIHIGSEIKTILSHIGDSVTLLDSFYQVSAGSSFIAKAGCDHSLETCDSKFANHLNYGGCPWIPSEDNIVLGKPFTY